MWSWICWGGGGVVVIIVDGGWKFTSEGFGGFFAVEWERFGVEGERG